MTPGERTSLGGDDIYPGKAYQKCNEALLFYFLILKIISIIFSRRKIHIIARSSRLRVEAYFNPYNILTVS